MKKTSNAERPTSNVSMPGFHAHALDHDPDLVKGVALKDVIMSMIRIMSMKLA
jgi:hypothetical protein